MNSIQDIPELQNLHSLQNVVRIPREIDVPITKRVKKLMDTPEFRRLARISQLGLVSLVYPAANHTRFEHSLGVYRLALLYLRQLSRFDRFHELVTAEDAEILIVAALLHDLGHWPFCHPIEDMHLTNVPEHELFANSFLLEGEVANCLRDDWGINPRDVVTLLSGKPKSKSKMLLQSILSGPLDIDKMDYLQRDSLHAGVPYGQNFDQQRLMGSLCMNVEGNRLAITEKGKTAAEMMVFSRYIMFSEVYWHHAVRSATAMLQRAFYHCYPNMDLNILFRMDESRFVESMFKQTKAESIGELWDGLFGDSRLLYKRLFEVGFLDTPELYERLAHKGYSYLAKCSERFALELSHLTGIRVAPYQVLIDAPPSGHETQFLVDIISAKTEKTAQLHERSPIVNSIASKSFDAQVKRVRVFVHPSLRDRVLSSVNVKSLIEIATTVAT